MILLDKQVNNTIEYENYAVVWDQYEPWTGDPNPFPVSREFPSKNDAIAFAKWLSSDDDPNLLKYTIEVIHYYRNYGNKKLQTEKIKWQ